jgi:hypothetical protein
MTERLDLIPPFYHHMNQQPIIAGEILNVLRKPESDLEEI